MSWLVDHLGPNRLIGELVEQIGALLVGRRTFDGDDPYLDTPGEGEAFGGAWHGPQVVLTHSPPAGPVPNVTFAQDLSTAAELAADRAGDSYVDVLGADLAAQCLQRGLLDEILLPGGTPVPLEPMRVTQMATVTNVWFRVIRR